MDLSRPSVSVIIVLFTAVALVPHAFGADPVKPLTGKWKIAIPARDAAGNPCPFVPEEMEYFSDGTMTMSNMPGGRVPFRIDLTAEERQVMEARDPSWKGKKLLLIKPMPQMEWRSTPMAYSYSIDKDKLTLSVTGWSPAVFQRVK